MFKRRNKPIREEAAVAGGALNAMLDGLRDRERLVMFLIAVPLAALSYVWGAFIYVMIAIGLGMFIAVVIKAMRDGRGRS